MEKTIFEGVAREDGVLETAISSFAYGLGDLAWETGDYFSEGTSANFFEPAYVLVSIEREHRSEPRDCTYFHVEAFGPKEGVEKAVALYEEAKKIAHKKLANKSDHVKQLEQQERVKLLKSNSESDPVYSNLLRAREELSERECDSADCYFSRFIREIDDRTMTQETYERLAEFSYEGLKEEFFWEMKRQEVRRRIERSRNGETFWNDLPPALENAIDHVRDDPVYQALEEVKSQYMPFRKEGGRQGCLAREVIGAVNIGIRRMVKRQMDEELYSSLSGKNVEEAEAKILEWCRSTD